MYAKQTQKTLLIVVSILFSPLNSASVPLLTTSAHVANAGYFQLQWQGSTSVAYELQQATDRHFSSYQLLYSGVDSSRVISGLGDGNYYFRVRESDHGKSGDWSEVVKVEVAHHDLFKAWTFFGLGVVIFLITITTLINGHRKER